MRRMYGILQPQPSLSYYTAAFFANYCPIMDTPTALRISIPKNATQENQFEEQEQKFDYSQRSQWLRAAVLGANDGLVSTASLMMGIGAVKKDVKAMILTGFAGLVAGACSMAIGEFVSVYSQLEIELAQMKRETETREDGETIQEGINKETMPNPIAAALASGLAFSLGAIVPLLAAAFIVDHKIRLIIIIAAVSLALVGFGWTGAVLGKAPVMRSCVRVVIGGWMAMAITFGVTKLISSGGLEM